MRNICCLLVLLASSIVEAQIPRLRVVSYNVENLFDCQHDSLKDDCEFLPDGLNRWTYSKYQDKLTKIAKVIVAAGEEQLPDLVALCEVENDRTLRDLTRYSVLRQAGYRYIMTDSPDERGIDVALLYQRGRFKPLYTQSIRLPKNAKNGRPTRDLLHVTGIVVTRDTLDVIVCHLPSRAGGIRMTQAYRHQVAIRLRAVCDSVRAVRQTARLIVLGDFNDNLSKGAVRESLGISSYKDGIREEALYDLVEDKAPGTYRYHGEWDLLDHILVSGSLLQPESTVYTTPEAARILSFPYLLEDDRKYGGQKPYRTHIGPRYNGGFSDHLPVCADLYLRDASDKSNLTRGDRGRR